MGWKDHLKWGFISSIILLILLTISAILKEISVIDITLFSSESIFDLSRFVFFGIAIPNIMIAFIGGLYGSIFPDIDIGTSKAFYITFMIILPILFYYVFIEYFLGLLIGLILMGCIISLKHRGIMHKPYTAIIIGFIVFLFFNSIIIALFFTMGFMVHLACDRDLGDD
ncbi:metal-dependent hydrolase [candidate division WOR-3 bacterium]|nr:metal-dependent hydrolase [candidate division WOR-3 bacterium]